MRGDGGCCGRAGGRDVRHSVPGDQGHLQQRAAEGDGDDRTGESAEGENLRVDLSRLGEIRRILVFTYIYEGTPNWAGANAIVTLYPQGGAPIEILLDEHDPSARTCAIALMESTGSDLSVRREVRYINGTQSALDAAYGWGMSWTKGRK